MAKIELEQVQASKREKRETEGLDKCFGCGGNKGCCPDNGNTPAIDETLEAKNAYEEALKSDVGLDSYIAGLLGASEDLGAVAPPMQQVVRDATGQVVAVVAVSNDVISSGPSGGGSYLVDRLITSQLTRNSEPTNQRQPDLVQISGASSFSVAPSSSPTSHVGAGEVRSNEQSNTTEIVATSSEINKIEGKVWAASVVPAEGAIRSDIANRDSRVDVKESKIHEAKVELKAEGKVEQKVGEPSRDSKLVETAKSISEPLRAVSSAPSQQQANTAVSSASPSYTSALRNAAGPISSGPIATTSEQPQISRTSPEVKLTPSIQPRVTSERILRGEERTESIKTTPSKTEAAVTARVVASSEQPQIARPALDTKLAPHSPALVKDYQPLVKGEVAIKAEEKREEVKQSSKPNDTIAIEKKTDASKPKEQERKEQVAVQPAQNAETLRASATRTQPAAAQQYIQPQQQLQIARVARVDLPVVNTSGSTRTISVGTITTVARGSAAGAFITTNNTTQNRAPIQNSKAVANSQTINPTSQIIRGAEPVTVGLKAQSALLMKAATTIATPIVKQAGVKSAEVIVNRSRVAETSLKPPSTDTKIAPGQRIMKGAENKATLKQVDAAAALLKGVTIKRELSTALREAAKVVNSVERKHSSREATAKAKEGVVGRSEAAQLESARKRQPTLRPNQNQEVQRALEQIRAILLQLDADQRVAALAMLESGVDLDDDRVLGSLEDFGIATVLEDDVQGDDLEEEQTIEELSSAPVIDGEGAEVEHEEAGAVTGTAPKAQLDLDIMGESGVPAEGGPERFMAYLSIEQMRFPHSNFALAM